MADVPVQTLAGFRLAQYFHREVMEQAMQANQHDLVAKSVNWTQAEGPAWQGRGWDSTILFGFQLQPSGLWSLVTDCTKCHADGCWHVVALGRRVIAGQGETLVAWQRQADRTRGSSGYDWRGRPMLVPREPSAEEKFEAWMSVRQASAGSLKPEQLFMGRSGGGTTDDLIFMVSRAEGKHARLQLDAGFSRPMKSKSGMTKFADGNDSYPERPMPHCMHVPVYAEYARWCASNFAGMKGQSRWSGLVLDERGLEMVKTAAESGRLYVYDSSTDRPVGPAKWGETRHLKWQWEAQQGDLWDVSHEIEGGADPYFGDVPMFVDLKGLVVGELDLQGMDASNAEMVDSAPLIPQKWLQENAQSSLALKFLPRPPEVVVQRSSRIIQGVQPIPVLTVEVKDKKDVFGFDLASSTTTCWTTSPSSRTPSSSSSVTGKRSSWCGTWVRRPVPVRR